MPFNMLKCKFGDCRARCFSSCRICVNVILNIIDDYDICCFNVSILYENATLACACVCVSVNRMQNRVCELTFVCIDSELWTCFAINFSLSRSYQFISRRDTNSYVTTTDGLLNTFACFFLSARLFFLCFYLSNRL